MKCIRCGNETENPDGICADCRRAEAAFRKKVRMEGEEHAQEVRREEVRRQQTPWKERMGLMTGRNRVITDSFILSAISLAVSLVLSFLLAFLVGNSLTRLINVTGLEQANVVNGFAVLKMAYFNDPVLSIHFTAVGVTSDATATVSLSVLILALIPFLSFKAAWTIFLRWIHREPMSPRETALTVGCVLALYVFFFAVTSFVPVWWAKEEAVGISIDAKMYVTLASSIVGTGCVALAANLLALRRRHNIRDRYRDTVFYRSGRALTWVVAAYLGLALVVAVAGVILFLSRHAREWTAFSGAVCLLPNLMAAAAGILSGGGYEGVIHGESRNAVSAWFPGGVIGMVFAMLLVLGMVLAVMIYQYRKLREQTGRRYWIHVAAVTAGLVLIQAIVWKVGQAVIAVETPSIIYRLFHMDTAAGVSLGSSFWRMAAVVVLLSAAAVVCEHQMGKREETQVFFDAAGKYGKIAAAVAPVGIFIFMLVLGLFL